MTEQQKMEIFIQKGYTYNSETGEIFNSRGKLTKVTGELGYGQICTSLNKVIVITYSHRFAWYYHYGEVPKQTIDHINSVRDDNRICNLRDVSLRENCNYKGGKGYTISKRKNGKIKYYAQIGMSPGVVKYLGTFDTATEARAAYLEAKWEKMRTLR